MTVSGVKSLSHKLARSRGSYVRIWNGLTEPAAAIVQPQERRRARLLASALIAIILLVGFALILLFVFQAELYLILGALALAGLLVAYGFTRTPYPMIGGGIALGVIAGVPYIAALIDPGRLFVLLFLLDSTLLSLLLFKMRTTGIVVIAALAAMFAFPFIQPKADAITLFLVIMCFALGSVLAMGIQIIRRQEQQHEQQYERQARVIADSEIQLIQARILIDEAQPDDQQDFEEALSLLNTIGNNILPELQPVANEYRARAQYNLEAYDDALTLVNQALTAAETGSRYYLRGLIQEAQGDTEAALRDYDWVLTLSAIYPYPFLPDVRDRAEALRAE